MWTPRTFKCSSVIRSNVLSYASDPYWFFTNCLFILIFAWRKHLFLKWFLSIFEPENERYGTKSNDYLWLDRWLVSFDVTQQIHVRYFFSSCFAEHNRSIKFGCVRFTLVSFCSGFDMFDAQKNSEREPLLRELYKKATFAVFFKIGGYIWLFLNF